MVQFSNPACKDVGALGLLEIKMGSQEPRSIVTASLILLSMGTLGAGAGAGAGRL